MSMPRRSSVAVVATSSMTICSPRNSSSLPAEREEAKNRTLSAGEVPLDEDVAHDATDLAGGSDDSDGGHSGIYLFYLLKLLF